MRKFNKFFSLEYNFKLKESFRQRNRKYLLSFFLECPYFVLFFPPTINKMIPQKKILLQNLLQELHFIPSNLIIVVLLPTAFFHT